MNCSFFFQADFLMLFLKKHVFFPVMDDSLHAVFGFLSTQSLVEVHESEESLSLHSSSAVLYSVGLQCLPPGLGFSQILDPPVMISLQMDFGGRQSEFCEQIAETKFANIFLKINLSTDLADDTNYSECRSNLQSRSTLMEVRKYFRHDFSGCRQDDQV